MKPGRVVALVIGCLMLLPGLGLLLGGAGIAIAYGVARDDAGYLHSPLTRVESQSVAVTTGTFALSADLQGEAWLTDSLDADIRLRVTQSGNGPMFIGVAPTADVDAYLAGAPHDDVTGIAHGAATVATTPGTGVVPPPSGETFWSAKASGVGLQQLNFPAMAGDWKIVVMNADGSAGISTTAVLEVRVAFLLPLGLILVGIGLLILAGAIVLIVIGASGGGSDSGRPAAATSGSIHEGVSGGRGPRATADHPVVLTARLDAALSRWKWLVKWFLAIPHYLILVFLWPAFIVLTTVAGFAILFTGKYPPALFEFNSGVLRWSWRVSYYAFNGGMGTDRYPHSR
ncbi:DUF4389 domain-containing protein [Nakamurella antarctica]|uniref:DUF4389 domain-containing protein n=1 Tax=Nakamurella antarctica TaxID=1902245 RepID=UPI0019D25D16|nr:DUF4389 domain-containing protein [Nakamurella antarctica]